jgi:hypothetical protein
LKATHFITNKRAKLGENVGKTQSVNLWGSPVESLVRIRGLDNESKHEGREITFDSLGGEHFGSYFGQNIVRPIKLVGKRDRER